MTIDVQKYLNLKNYVYCVTSNMKFVVQKNTIFFLKIISIKEFKKQYYEIKTKILKINFVKLYKI